MTAAIGAGLLVLGLGMAVPALLDASRNGPNSHAARWYAGGVALTSVGAGLLASEVFA